MARVDGVDWSQVIKALCVGGGTVIKKIWSTTVSVNPASIATVTRGATAVTIAGLAAGDVVIAVPPAALEDDLIYVGCRVTGANTVTVYLYNPTGSPIDAAAANWDFLCFDLT